MAILRTSVEHQRRQSELLIEAMRKARAAKSERALLAAVTAYQVAAFTEGAAAVPLMLAEQGAKAEAVAQVRTLSLVGAASDGRTMQGLVQVMQTLPPAFRDRIVSTQVADAARAGGAVAMAVRPSVKGFARQVSVGACSRCVVLAGRIYKSREAFNRHPRCNCTHIPAAEDRPDDLTTDPKAYFDSLSEGEQDATFTKAGAIAIRDGADMGQVVNARRGMSTAQPGVGRLARDKSGLYTTTANMQGRKVRLMPESIIELADTTEERLRLLKAHGYIR